MADAGRVHAVAETELVASAHDHGAAIFVVRVQPLLECPGRRLLADEGDGAMAARHVEHLVHRPVRRVRRDLDQELRRRERTFVHHLQDDLRDVVEFARSVLARAAEADGLVPVVVDRTPLPKEVLQLFAELRLRRAPGREIGVVVRREEHVQLSQRTALDAVEVLGPEEVEPHEHHHVVGRLGSAVAQALQAGDFLFETVFIAFATGSFGVMEFFI